MIQTGNEKTYRKTNRVVMFYSGAVLQVMTALCYSSVYHEKRVTKARQPSPFLSQLPFEPHTVCICRFDLVVGIMILLLVRGPKQTTCSRRGRKKQTVSLGYKTQTLLGFAQELGRALRTREDKRTGPILIGKKARLYFTTVTLNQYYQDQLQ